MKHLCTLPLVSFLRAPLMGLLIGLALTSLPATSLAEEVSAENKAAARDLAVDGIKLAQEGKCEEAVGLLKRAENLYHAPTILTWIGQCQIQMGKYVEGTESLNRVVRERLEPGAPEAYAASQKKAQSLIEQAKPKIGKLTIKVTPEGIEGLEVRVDDSLISSALVGAAKPTDPGKHSIIVSAPGYKPQTAEVELSEGGRESVELTLEADPDAPAAVTPNGQEPAAAAGKQGPNWVGWGTLGAGAALMAGGGVMGILALGKKKDLNCADDGTCAPSQEDTLNSARTNAMISTILFGVGGAAAVTGIVLLITDKPSRGESASRSLQPLVGFGSLGLSGQF